MPLLLPNTIDRDTTADAVEVEQNFSVAQQYVNTNVITRDGSVAMTNPLLLAGDPTQPNQAANKGYVDGRNALYLPLTGGTVTGQIKGVTPVADEDLTRKDYVDTTTVSLTGDTVTGQIKGIAPVAAEDLTRKDYVDGLNATTVKKSGAQVMAGPLTVSDTIIANNHVAISDAPTAVNHATRKDYVDTKLSESGGQLTGDLVVASTGGGSPFTGFRGCELTTNGAIGSLRTSGTEGVNLQLFKAGTAYANGQHLRRVLRHKPSATVKGAITQVATGVLYNETSDYRLKDELGPVVDPVERLMQLQPKHLRMKAEGVEFDGFLAHEVQAVVPEAVTGEKDAMAGDDIAPQLLDHEEADPVARRRLAGCPDSYRRAGSCLT